MPEDLHGVSQDTVLESITQWTAQEWKGFLIELLSDEPSRLVRDILETEPGENSVDGFPGLFSELNDAPRQIAGRALMNIAFDDASVHARVRALELSALLPRSIDSVRLVALTRDVAAPMQVREVAASILAERGDEHAQTLWREYVIGENPSLDILYLAAIGRRDARRALQELAFLDLSNDNQPKLYQVLRGIRDEAIERLGTDTWRGIVEESLSTLPAEVGLRVRDALGETGEPSTVRTLTEAIFLLCGLSSGTSQRREEREFLIFARVAVVVLLLGFGFNLLTVADLLRTPPSRQSRVAEIVGTIENEVDRAVMLIDYAMVETVLGEGKRSVFHLREARAASDAARALYDRDEAPREWGMTQISLGDALRVLGQRSGDDDYLLQAISAYRAALQVLTPEGAPVEWARTQTGLGEGLQVLGQRNQDEAGLEEAIEAFRAALAVYIGREALKEGAIAHANLGNSLQILGELKGDPSQLAEAKDAFSMATEACEEDRQGRHDEVSELAEALVIYRLERDVCLRLSGRGAVRDDVKELLVSAFEKYAQQILTDQSETEAQWVLVGDLHARDVQDWQAWRR